MKKKFHVIFLYFWHLASERKNKFNFFGTRYCMVLFFLYIFAMDITRYKMVFSIK
jgi:hypothetical protein